MAEKGPKNFSRFMRHFPTTDNIHTDWIVWIPIKITIYDDPFLLRVFQ